jgi:hypothetical protein
MSQYRVDQIIAQVAENFDLPQTVIAQIHRISANEGSNARSFQMEY